ncbi:MAG: motility protein MotB [Gammaproteobacteria bacterium]|nr:MAG: motility protein MotB [Gammaproteobacteria bacterium]
MSEQPIVIKRIYKVDGHHGGSWKVAFADFATAMMAFFLLMWIMGQTTEEEKGAISEFFNNPSAVPGASSVPPPAGSFGQGGPSNAVIDLGGSMELPREVSVEAEVAEANRAMLGDLRAELLEAMEEQSGLADYTDHILIDVSPEGLRIQIVDQERLSMFPLGSANLEPFAQHMIRELALILDKDDILISISGHTDSLPIVRAGYSNWELSTDRANAARRALVEAGLDEERLGRVVGLGSTVPLLEEDPAHAVNRRISILVMNQDSIDSMRAAARGLVVSK